MKPIKKEDIIALNDIVMDLPAFRDLKSKDMISEVLDEFLNDLYIDTPKEIFDTFDFNLGERMQETFFANYGIDRAYVKAIKGNLKKDLSYNLEKLFQHKGSRKIFEMFASIFKNVFRKINFYNIKVYKVPTKDGFRFEYRLDPLYISDENNIILYPQIPIEQTRKYLMELENFEDYTFWPMPTNIVYIQLSIGEEIINNMETFLNGVRSYGTTYLQGKIAQYRDEKGFIENIHLADLELIVSYFKIEIVKKHNPDWEFHFPDIKGSYLPYDPLLNPNPDPTNPNYDEIMKWTKDRETFLLNMQDLLQDYGKANRASRQDMEVLRRRWQFFLNLKERENICFNNYDDLYNLIKNKYPLLQRDFLEKLALSEADTEDIFDFYIYIYIIFLNGVNANPEDPALGLNEEWVFDYVDVLFGELFIEADFLKWYFTPVLEMFIKYFFPIEMEYINDLIQKVLIKDKWNSISYDDSKYRFVVRAGHFSREVYPLDYRKYYIECFNRHSYIDEKSMAGCEIYHPQETLYEKLRDKYLVKSKTLRKSKIKISDNFQAKIVQGPNNPLVGLSFGVQQFKTRSRTCFPTRGTKKYLIDVLNAAIK